MRCMFLASAPWTAVGYATPTKALLPRLKALGHDVALTAFYGLEGGMIAVDGIPIYPQGYDPYAQDVLPDHVRHFDADVLLTLIDAFVLKTDLRERCQKRVPHPVRHVAWLPIDHAPLGEALTERLPLVDYPLAFSQWGRDVVEAEGFPCRYVPLGVEPAVFCPGDQQQARATLNAAMGRRDGAAMFPADAWIVSMVAANKGYPSRKAFPECLEAFARFHARRPEAILYLHTQTGEKMGGIDFAALVKALGLAPTAVRLVDQYAQHIGLPDTFLADVYRASDVLLGASYAEGFGVPLIEAQASGCPVITTDATSMTELTHNGIATAPLQRWWSQQGGWQAVPSIDAIDRALEAVYQRTSAETAQQAFEGSAWARLIYGWDTITRDYWVPLLAEIEGALRPRCVAEAVAG